MGHYSETYKKVGITVQFVVDSVKQSHPRGLICLPQIDNGLAEYLDANQSFCTDGVLLDRMGAFVNADNVAEVWEYEKRTGRKTGYTIVRPGGE